MGSIKFKNEVNLMINEETLPSKQYLTKVLKAWHLNAKQLIIEGLKCEKDK